MSIYDQGSKEWKIHRRKCVTSSDAAVLMKCHASGMNVKQLWEQKKNGHEIYINESMYRGSKLEPEAREWYMGKKGFFSPKVIFNKENPLFMSSLDGISLNGEKIIEIKCPGDKNHLLISSGIIPPYYYAQCQWHMLVTDIYNLDLISYDGFEGVIQEIKREDLYIYTLKKRAEEFLKYLNEDNPDFDENYENIEADLCEKDLIEQWKTVYIQLKTLKEKEKVLRENICCIGKDQNFIINYEGKKILKGIKIKKQGIVEWDKLCKENKINESTINKFRKENLEFYRLDPMIHSSS